MTWRFGRVGARMALILGSVLLLVLAGCSRAPNAPVKLGATFPLTGDVASYGQAAKAGIELAVDEANAAGGVHGRRIQVDFQDDKNDAKTAVGIVKQFASIQKYPVVFGSAGSSVTLALAPVANREKVVLVSPISSSTKLSTEGGRFFFRTCPADDLQAEVLAKWVAQDGRKRVALVYTSNAWGQPLADGFKAEFGASGGSVAMADGSPENSTDFRTVITKVKSSNGIDAVVSPTYPKEGGAFVRQCRELGLSLPLYGGDNWGSPEFRKIAGTAADGVFYTAPSQPSGPAYDKFARAFEAKLGKKPDVFAAYAYDAANAVFQAMKSGKRISGDAVRDGLTRVSFTGVSGRVRFRPNGDIDSESVARMTIAAGQPKAAR